MQNDIPKIKSKYKKIQNYVPNIESKISKLKYQNNSVLFDFSISRCLCRSLVPISIHNLVRRMSST